MIFLFGGKMHFEPHNRHLQDLTEERKERRQRSTTICDARRIPTTQVSLHHRRHHRNSKRLHNRTKDRRHDYSRQNYSSGDKSRNLRLFTSLKKIMSTGD